MKVKDLPGCPVTEKMIKEWVKKGLWEPGFMFWMLWDENAKKRPNKEALVDQKTRLTWAQAREQSANLALGFQELGLKKDNVVVSQLPNCVEAVLLRDALERLGVVYFPLAVGFRHKEMKHLLEFTQAVAIVVPGIGRFDEGFDFVGMVLEIKPELPKLKYVVTVGQAPQGTMSLAEVMALGAKKKVPWDYFKKSTFDFDECVAFRATSGTTGLPKVCCATTPLHNKEDFITRWKVTENDVVMAIATIATGAGLPAIELSGPTGCKALMMERWDPQTGPERALSLIEKERVTIACGVPPHILMIAQHPNVEKYNISSLRLFTWAGAPLAKGAVAGIEKRLGCKLVPYYGSMDAGAISAAYYDDSIEVRSSTVGKPYSKRELKIIDPDTGKEVPHGEIGEVLVRGAVGNLGYYKDLEHTKANWDSEGWFHTKDLGKIDEEGNICLMGRATDTINRGGQKIHPLEVEEILKTHPKVAEVVIVPMPDPIVGQRACAYVEPKAGQTFTFEEMIARLEQEKMAKYKRPERLEIMERLPRLPSGKVDKTGLAEDIKKKLEAQAKK